jgi:malate/lactate dehydrogenase
MLTGAAGGIGQPLALLLKGSPLIGELSLYDIVGTEGVGADLSHIDSSVKVGASLCCWPVRAPSNATNGFCMHGCFLRPLTLCANSREP